VFPILKNGFLWLFEAVGLSADEEAGAVVIVIGSIEGLEVCEVFFDFGKLLLSRVSLQLVLYLGLLVGIFALLEIGLGALAF
jgi:hypothetical protein